MGCDGGTIPKRDELVRMKKKPEQKDKNADMVAKWQHCALSQEPLRPPIMACEMGHLYNKEALLEALLDKSGNPNIQHIRGLKDVKELQLTENPARKDGKPDSGDAYADHQAAKYICPVVGLEMSGRYQFCFLWGCGCVFSERALKEVQTKTCHKCGAAFSQEDVVTLNPAEDDLPQAKERMEQRRLKAKADKKAKKQKRSAAETVSKAPAEASSSSGSSPDGPSSSKLTNGALSSSTDGPPPSKLTKLTNGASSSRVDKSRGSTKPNGAQKGKASSIYHDPNRSEVFKSLFTSHHNAKERVVHCASWVNKSI
ncbi:replication termination factor 2-like [Branchiostoma floridae x Branchiostoma japonicum]